jgi:hypothetical protein
MNQDHPDCDEEDRRKNAQTIMLPKSMKGWGSPVIVELLLLTRAARDIEHAEGENERRSLPLLDHEAVDRPADCPPVNAKPERLTLRTSTSRAADRFDSISANKEISTLCDRLFCLRSEWEVLLCHYAVIRPIATWRWRELPRVVFVENSENRPRPNALPDQFHQNKFQLGLSVRRSGVMLLKPPISASTPPYRG